MKHLEKNVFLFALICAIYSIQAQNCSFDFKDGRLFIIDSSHQDIAWMDSPKACIQSRSDHMFTPELERMAESKDFYFSVEDALSLRKYLKQHPEKYDKILQSINKQWQIICKRN